MQYSAQQIASLLRTIPPVNPNAKIDVLLTDSRSLTYPERTLFFALTTPSGDGHRYVAELYRRGVKNFVVRRRPDTADACYADANFFVVPDVKESLQRLAQSHRDKFTSLPVIGITGSRGKTTLKEWLNHLLGSHMHTVRSPRSYNSQIGVPLSLWEIGPDAELGIFEAGISEYGEMDSLRRMISPTLGIITNVGIEHADGFSSRSDKCDEKLRLFTGCPLLIHSVDDPLLAQRAADAIPAKQRLTISRIGAREADIRIHAAIDRNAGVTNIRFSSPRFAMEGAITIPFTSEAALDNASLSIATLMALGIDPVEVSSGFSTMPHIDTRLNVVEGVNDCTLITDHYSSDYPSLLSALDFMNRRRTPDTRATVILPDMKASSPSDNATIYDNAARLLTRHSIDRVICIGHDISRHADMFAGMETKSYPTLADFIAIATPSEFDHELILIKGGDSIDVDKITDMLEARQHETVLEVDLDAMVHNFNLFRAQLLPHTGIVAMVKASGYGAGSYELARTLQNQGAAYLAVAVADEAMDLRKSGITMPIMVLNPKVTNYRTLFAHMLEPEVYSFDILHEIISEGRRYGVKGFPIHIKLDTGMHRLGFLGDDIDRLINELKSQDVVTPRSTFSHLAAADCPAMDDYNRLQFDLFDDWSSRLKEAFPDMLRHILNSTGITRFPQYQYDMVRLGICLYGIPTLDDGSQADLQPVSSLRTVVISIKEWHAGTTIGYGRKGVLTRDSRIATIPIGYADGLRRALGCGKSSVWINGTLCPIVGNICMDICMIDVTDAQCSVGDRVEIFGPNISVATIADTLGTIPYEVLTSVSTRVKRVYFRE
ncbi:bifunctional UDP-N-acetylmuramoyl-tripeptide:D-alanyl-D-alanine ligase/alanine racemase [uncultured Muribaculum sp.]|uniref:bifunctional UDP-N-acetylmuramoyl-tripeptide:D-alanyl-D-alanine ligase/alanine racemase n=1 Tax=uncultured Muribaculum sp. TaxID=1918613 RepID=UPI0025FD6F62|nr:bifunctional UDP-N-acetylmuramoyl-tripeptide:D-alanyl-D-alanine ligase/alanine racemase [uncultured Muribaculum sp.]